MSDVEDRAGVLPERVREAPSGVEAPPGDHVRGRRPPRGRAPAPRPLLDLGGTYGDPEAGDHIQYDELRIEHDEGDVEIVVYNRAILLFTTDSEAVRRIHPGVLGCRNDNRGKVS